MSFPQPASIAIAPALASLAAKCADKRVGGLVYAGDVNAVEAYGFLQQFDGVVVDVRTIPEWQFVGMPELAGTKGVLATISWKLYPDFSTNARFQEQLETLPDLGANTPLFFLCRSGGRSLDAAVAMTAAGYKYCFNITDGFEGEPQSGHRGNSGGWKALNLPWKQS